MKRTLVFFFLLLGAEQILAQSIVVTEEEIAKGLLLKKNEHEKQTKELAQYLNQTSYAEKNLVKNCKSNQASKKSLCELIKILELKDERSEKFVRKETPTNYASVPEFINRKTFEQAQKARPGELLDALRKYSFDNIMSWLPILISSKKCPQNLLVASLRMYELALPKIKAQASLEVGYQRAAQCLKTYDSYFELTHIRQGLLRHMWGDREGAITAFRAALKTTEPKEKEITLFWLGYLQKNQKLRDVYWNHLITEYPLNFHSIHASRIMNTDPFSRILKKAFIVPQRNTHLTFSQKAIYWIESLYIFGEKKAATNLSYKISGKLNPYFSRANKLYIAALADKYNLPSDSVRISNFILSKDPEVINLQILKHLHPRPFEKAFDRAEVKVDHLIALSVAKQESGFNPLARSPANARGFMQILPSTAANYNVKSESYLYDLETNIEVGSEILSDLMKKQSRMDFALAAYNAGPNKVEEWKKRYNTQDPMLFIDLIPYSETRGYVAKVLRNHYWYSVLYDKEKLQN